MYSGKYPNIFERFVFSLLIIIFINILLRLILVYIDKRSFDTIFILDMIFGALFMISLTISTFVKEHRLDVIFLITHILLLIPNYFLPFFEYIGVKRKDFFSINLFFAIFGCICLIISYPLKLEYQFYRDNER